MGNDIDKSLPKFSYSKAAEGAVTQCELVHHNYTPILVGKIVREGQHAKVHMVRNPTKVAPEVLERFEHEMSKWFYYTYLQPGKA